MSAIISLIQIILALILFIIGLGLNKGFRTSKMQENIMGSEGFAPGYKTRQFTLLIFSVFLIIIALILFYNAFSRKIF